MDVRLTPNEARRCWPDRSLRAAAADGSADRVAALKSELAAARATLARHERPAAPLRRHRLTAAALRRL